MTPHRSAPVAGLLGALPALALAGCINVQYGRTQLEEPISHAQLERLRPDHADLTACLRELGAPNLVWEYDGSGVALGYVWQDEDAFGVKVSYSITDKTPGVSFSYGSDAADLPGCVLWFDDGLVLREWRRGIMGELTRSLRHRPAAPVDDEPEGAR